MVGKIVCGTVCVPGQGNFPTVFDGRGSAFVSGMRACAGADRFAEVQRNDADICRVRRPAFPDDGKCHCRRFGLRHCAQIFAASVDEFVFARNHGAVRKAERSVGINCVDDCFVQNTAGALHADTVPCIRFREKCAEDLAAPDTALVRPCG